MSIVSVHGHLGGSQHRRAGARIFQLLLRHEKFTVVGKEVRLPFGRGSFPYVADIYAEIGSQTLIIEVDGKTGHASKKAVQLDKERDAECKKRGIAVVRFNTSDIVGRKAITDSQIMEELDFRLKA